MNTRQHIQKKHPSQSTYTPVQNLYQTRAFDIQQQPSHSSSGQENVDLDADHEQSQYNRYNLPYIPVNAPGTEPPPPIQTQLNSGEPTNYYQQGSAQARAFTTGQDLFFRGGEYNPGSRGGQELIAHELTHVVQQTGTVQQKGSEYFSPLDIQLQSLNNLLQCKIVTIGTENVNVADENEEKEAHRIIKNIKDEYEIDLSSQSGVDAIKNDYTNAPDNVKKGLQTKEWEFKELKALEKALQHFAPILGKRRKASSLSKKDQEITSASKVDQAIDADDPSGVLDSTTLGEYFESSKNFSMFSAGTNSKVDFKDSEKQLEGTAIHEIAHGLLKYALSDYVKALDYWTDEDTKSGKAAAEEPITEYGKTNASEDLSEAVMYYFVETNEFEKKCPKRYEFIKQIIKDWTKKKNNP
jgi:hypothetical protein